MIKSPKIIITIILHLNISSKIFPLSLVDLLIIHIAFVLATAAEARFSQKLVFLVAIKSASVSVISCLSLETYYYILHFTEQLL